MNTVDFQSGYSAAHSTAVVVDRSDLGWLKLTGATRVDLIQRMSTQDLRGLQSGEGRATVLTTDIGRIIDRLILYAENDVVYMLTSENNADNIARYLMRFVFFNDDFQIEDLSNQTAILGVYGKNAGAMLHAAGYDFAELPLHHHVDVGQNCRLHRADAVAGEGYLIVGDSAEKAILLETLTNAGVVPIDEPTFDYLRIESGQPRLRHELTSDYIPLETGLWDDVSFSKGCYTGQEIIARMESRGRLAKRLVQLSAEAPISNGAAITANGKAAGTITSAASNNGDTVAMGYVKNEISRR